MKAELARGGTPAFRATSRQLCAALAAATLVTGSAGCAGVRNTGADALPLPPVPVLTSKRDNVVQEALAWHQSLRGMGASELARERAAQGGAGATPLAQMRQAMLLSHPQGSYNLSRAITLLEAVATSDKADAVALRPLARLLAEQLQERQRLENTAERLTQQLERAGQQLRDSQKQGEQLQEKLDALTEIERTLPARPAAPAAPQPSATERRNTR